MQRYDNGQCTNFAPLFCTHVDKSVENLGKKNFSKLGYGSILFTSKHLDYGILEGGNSHYNTCGVCVLGLEVHTLLSGQKGKEDQRNGY